jgi:branched-chain amino acid transport system permease protein
MVFAATLIVAGLSVGSIYALIAITLNLTFWTTRTVNFGQGSVLMLCAMGTVFLASLGLPLWSAALVAIIFSGIVTVLTERIAVRPALNVAGSMGWAVSTLGFGILIQGLVAKYLGTQAVAFPDVILRSDLFLEIGGIRVGAQYLLVFAFSVLTIVLLEFLLRKTVWGRVMRAVAQDRELASVMGIPVYRVILLSFVASGCLAGIAGMLTAQIIGTVDPAFGFKLLISGFIAGIVGGFGKNTGALAGGLLIGVLEQLAGGYISTAVGHAISLGLLLVMLALRPYGLFGREEVSKA